MEGGKIPFHYVGGLKRNQVKELFLIPKEQYTEITDEMTKIRKISTFFGNIEKPGKVESFTKGSELAERIEALYELKKKYS